MGQFLGGMDILPYFPEPGGALVPQLQSTEQLGLDTVIWELVITGVVLVILIIACIYLLPKTGILGGLSGNDGMSDMHFE